MLKLEVSGVSGQAVIVKGVAVQRLNSTDVRDRHRKSGLESGHARYVPAAEALTQRQVVMPTR